MTRSRIFPLWMVTAAILLLPLLIPLPGAAQDAPTLRPGDVVQIDVWRQPELSGSFEIARNGTIAHPLYREVVVAETPMAEVERRIGEFLLRFESNPQFVVAGRFRISVGGQVVRPGILELRPGITLREAIQAAGGPAERARLNRVLLRRDGSVRVFDLTRPTIESEIVVLESGDQVFVDRRTDVFRDYLAPTASIVSFALLVVRLFGTF